MAGKYDIKLINKKDIADNTMSFYFSKPEGFMYKAGQSMDLTLINPSDIDSEGNTRTFTIATSPQKKFLMIATRIRDTAFKRNLKNMEIGTVISMEGPFGSFVLPNNSEIPIVFLTGGIGVTPAISIISFASENNLPHKIYLFCSNRTPAHGVFLDEFRELQIKNKNFVFVPTMTRIEGPSMWNGEKGYIERAMLEKYLENGIMDKLYFISGPMNMVSAMSDVLVKAGIDTDYIRTEEFPGY